MLARLAVDGRVQVWHYRLDVDDEQERLCARILDDSERERAELFRFAHLRKRFIVGRATLRTILGHCTDMDPRSLRFALGEHGKPYIDEPHCAHIRFNASDSQGLGAVAIAQGHEIGFDIERVRPNQDCDLIAASEFCNEEWEWLQCLPEPDRLTAFFALWTCKEAYLKGKGLGLTVPLNQFAIAMDSERGSRLAWSKIDRADPQHWCLQRLDIEPGFVACLAIEGHDRPVSCKPWQAES
jgi:4'-phosphopantetheinyl transferase